MEFWRPWSKFGNLARRTQRFMQNHNDDIEEMAKEAVAETGLNYDVMLYTDTLDSYRDPRQPILLVLDPPHEVRPPEHTGVDVISQEENGETNTRLVLNDAPNAHLYDHSAIRFQSRHDLCQACMDVFNYYCQYFATYSSEKASKTTARMINAVIHHFNILSLLAWSDVRKCYLCQRVLRSLEECYPGLFSRDLRKYQIEVCWSKRAPEANEKNTRLCFVLTNVRWKRSVYNCFHFFALDAWPSETYSSLFAQASMPARQFAVSGLPEPSHLPQRTSQSIDSHPCRTLATAWLATCKENQDSKHAECNRKHDGSYIPTRLLDVDHARKTSKLRIVDPLKWSKDFVQDWITLSHCWGKNGVEINPILTTENLSHRQEVGIEMDELPKTLLEAIEIANWFGVRWLWIDCLCIIQDSAEDWQREAELMSKTYQNAIINISADGAEDSRDGCFTERDPLEVMPMQLMSVQSERSWILTPDAMGIFAWMNRDPSLSRAWIHRERQLSKRILHFTTQGIVWECCGIDGTSFASEMMPNGSPSIPLWNRDAKFQSGRLQRHLIQGDEETYATWNDVCESFSRKHLTKAADMPVILSSLAGEFAEALPSDEYVAGLWRSTLPQSLLWKVLRKKKPDPTRSNDYIAPSWSWLSTSWEVELAKRSSPESKTPLAVVHEVLLDYPGHDHFSVLAGGYLKVEGILRRLQITTQITPHIRHRPLQQSIAVFDDQNIDSLRIIGDVCDEDEGVLCDVKLDTGRSWEDLDCFCLFLQLKLTVDGSLRELGCLLLKRRLDGTYYRIGVMLLHGAFATKMAYRQSTPDAESSRSQSVSSKSSSASEDVWGTLSTVVEEADFKRQDFIRALKTRQREGEATTKDLEELEMVTWKPPPVVDALYYHDGAGEEEKWHMVMGKQEVGKLVPQTITIV